MYSVDEKGRIILPAKYRDSFGNKCMMSKSQEKCVNVYPLEAWSKLVEKLDGLNMFRRGDRDFNRRFHAGSDESEIDRQGRTLIKQDFRVHGNLNKEVYIIGAGDHLEIWNKEAWELYRDKLDEGYESLGEELFQ